MSGPPVFAPAGIVIVDIEDAKVARPACRAEGRGFGVHRFGVEAIEEDRVGIGLSPAWTRVRMAAASAVGPLHGDRRTHQFAARQP